MGNADNNIISSATFGACYVELEDGRLAAGNALFRRTWRVGADGSLSAESFRINATDAEWLTASSGLPGPTPAGGLADEARTLTLAATPAPSAIEAESLTAELTATGEVTTLTYRFQLFPAVAGVRMRLCVIGGAAAVPDHESEPGAETAPTGLEQDPPSQNTAVQGTGAADGRDVLESFALAPIHLRLTQVTFRDQTDRHNELVSEQEWLLHPSERALALSGCLFYVEDVLSGTGLILLKEAPLPPARPVPSPHDLRALPSERRFTLAGHGADESGDGYAFVTLAYGGGTAGRVAALQRYQRCLRPYAPGRDGRFVSNTWGDRNRDGRINAEFMRREIEAGERLGVDVIQIDDGWQAGTTSNSVHARTAGGVWEGFYAAADDFWSVNPERFADGLTPLVSAARKKNMRFGLWFAPDSAGDFAHWRRDADTVLRLHRELGTTYVKIDGVKLRSKAGERNLHAFFDRVLTESDGQVVFDLDVTAEVRPGYFGIMHAGPLFVENRYTDWRSYWPHHTLRNLWKLAHHVDPVRLRMEWLNHERNIEKYEHDPLAPHEYRPDYLFATVLFSAPLGWFEVSSLPESYFAEAAPLIATWKQRRDALFGGTILPLGDAPDGVSWTGFASVSPNPGGTYLLLFREASSSAQWEACLPFLPDVEEPAPFTLLGGDGGATLLPGRRLSVTISEPRRFTFVHI